MFDPKSSNSIDSTSIQYSTHDPGSSVDWTLGAVHYSGQAVYVLDSLNLAPIGTQESQVIPDLSIRMLTEISTTYPDGSRYPLQVGQLALGSSDINQTFAIGNGATTIKASLVPDYLWETKAIRSSSYRLNIGSASLNLPLSLWFGGYDETRLLGPVSSLPSHNNDLDNFIIDLIDITIAVDHGGSPFAYRKRDGILGEGNNSMPNTIAVAMNPAAPSVPTQFLMCSHHQRLTSQL